METALTFAALGLLVVVASVIATRARQYARGDFDRREAIESLVGLCGSSLDADEARRVKLAIESRLQRL